ncbi:MAG: FAD-dependent oxidoreductase [Kiloniellales bacterium]
MNDDRRDAAPDRKEDGTRRDGRLPLGVAIVGAGPSGFYAAEAILKAGIDCTIDLLDALPSPFGLIRGGVAPDHQTTKRVTRAYEKIAKDSRVRYFGNVEIGRDLALEELRRLYDAVVLAVGAPLDRRLDIPGGDKEGVYGSAAFVGWYNGHPGHVDLAPGLDCERAVVVGNGNVALDVARVLVKTPQEMASSDLPDYAAHAIHGAPIREVVVIGRRGPLETRFSNKELSELAELADCSTLVDPAELPAGVDPAEEERERRVKEKNLATFRGFAATPDGSKRKTLRFRFFTRPVEVLGDARVEALRCERTELKEGRAVGTGRFFDIPCGLVVAAIGYRMAALQGLAIDPADGTVVNDDGRVERGLYVVGWARRGPVGVIGSSKPDGDSVARWIAEDLTASGKEGRKGLEKLLSERGRRSVSFADWLRIAKAEETAASPGAPRRKLTTVEEMLAVLDRPAAAEPAPRAAKTLQNPGMTGGPPRTK